MNIMKGIAGTGCLALPVAVKNVLLLLPFHCVGGHHLGADSFRDCFGGLHSRLVSAYQDERFAG